MDNGLHDAVGSITRFGFHDLLDSLPVIGFQVIIGSNYSGSSKLVPV